MAENRYLPGIPKQSLVKAVRAHLRGYGIRPKGDHDPTWHLTWQWAAKIAKSYLWREHWPNSMEIATQYVLLLLCQMRQDQALKLPHRAAEQCPPAVAEALGAQRPGLHVKLAPILIEE
jgi:hypothetical protein